MPNRISMAVAFLGVLTAGAPAAPVRAAPPEVIRGLEERPLSVFDFGVKGLRRSARDASQRFASPTEPGPAVRVWYDTAGDLIEILFQFRTADPTAVQSRAFCLDRRRQAIVETFRINSMASLDLSSPEQRIRRRIGVQFSKEPLPAAQQVLALGERLSELIFVTVEIAGHTSAPQVSCRGPVAQLGLK